MTSDCAAQSDPLHYAPPPPGGRRRKWLRRLILGCAAAVLAGVLFRWAYVPLHLKVGFLYHQSRCMAFAPAADTIAYSEDSATVKRLTAGAPSGPGWATLTVGRTPIAFYLMPPSLRRVEQTPGVDIPQGPGPVFLHRRRAEGGTDRLVVVKVDMARTWQLHSVSGFAPPADHLFDVTVVRPATLLSGPSFTRTLWDPAKTGEGRDPRIGRLTLYAGQPDPADASRFTIGYQTPDGRGTIKGRLLPDDTVKLRIEDGPLAP